MIVRTIARDPYFRERRQRDGHGRIIASEFVCYAYIGGKSKRMCSFETVEEATAYVSALGKEWSD